MATGSPILNVASLDTKTTGIMSENSSMFLLQVTGQYSSLFPSLGRKMAMGSHIVIVAMTHSSGLGV